MSGDFDGLTVFDWVTSLFQLARIASGSVQLEGTAGAIRELERAGVRVGAPILIHETGAYLFTVSKRDLPKVRRVAARAGVEVW